MEDGARPSGSGTVLVYRMALIPMQATRDFNWFGRPVRVGEYLEVTGAQSLALRHAQKAKFTKSSGGTYEVAALHPVTAEITPPRDPPPTRRRYRRRDLQAEE